jgi:hypothetical protein
MFTVRQARPPSFTLLQQQSAICGFYRCWSGDNPCADFNLGSVWGGIPIFLIILAAPQKPAALHRPRRDTRKAKGRPNSRTTLFPVALSRALPRLVMSHGNVGCPAASEANPHTRVITMPGRGCGDINLLGAPAFRAEPSRPVAWQVARFRMYSVRRACQEKYLRPAYAGDAPPGRFCERARF